MVLARLLKQFLRARPTGACARAQALLAAGDAARSRGETQEAERCWREALALAPENPLALCRIGMLLGERGDTAGSKPYFERAHELQPGLADALAGLGNVWWVEGDFPRAEDCLRRALAVEPDLAIAHRNLGTMLLTRGNREQAVTHLRRAWDLGLRGQELLSTVVRVEIELGRGDSAAEWLAAECAARPADPEPRLQLGRLFKELQEPRRARQWLELGLGLAPSDARGWTDLGTVLQDLGQIPLALECYERSLALRPDYGVAAYYRAVCELLCGNFERAWHDYEKRLEDLRIAPRRVRFPRWDGTAAPAQTVLVYTEQGVGDEIMFASCLPDLMARGVRVVYEARRRLAPLMARSFPQATVCASTGDGRLPAATAGVNIDSEIPIGSLPLHFRRTLQEFPAHRGYLVADPVRVQFWRDRLAALGPGLKVGMSWRGGTATSRQKLRSLTLEQLRPVLEVPGVHFVSLQYGDAREALRGAAGLPQIAEWPEAIDDLDETAALVSALDLVVSVCTAVIHLGGALGRPVWVLAPYAPEWRYGLTGEAMPWYPSVSVIRQPAFGEWDPVIAEVAARLRQRISAGGPAPGGHGVTPGG